MFVPAQTKLSGTKSLGTAQIFGLAQKVCAGPKKFGTVQNIKYIIAKSLTLDQTNILA